MKILDQDYRSEPSNQISSFCNDLISSFWASIPPGADDRLRDYFYELNRAICDAVKANVEIVSAEYTVSNEIVARHTMDIEKMAQSYLSKIVAEEILKSEKIPVSKWANYGHPTTNYTLRIPIFILKSESKKR